jgi:hypothetical protein
MAKKNDNRGEIVIYQSSKDNVELEVHFTGESVWLSQQQIAKLYGKDRSVITRHINKIFKDGEINKKSNVQKMHIANSDKPVNFYSLDIILAVGYRTNSANAIKFRKWSTKILKKYLIDGYALNKKRLNLISSKFNDLQATINFLKEGSARAALKGQEGEILNLLADYAKTLTLLESYDKAKVKQPKGKTAAFTLEYKNCLGIIKEIKRELIAKKEAGDLFGREVDHKFESIIKNLYQTFGGKALYKTIEDKAAHLVFDY